MSDMNILIILFYPVLENTIYFERPKPSLGQENELHASIGDIFIYLEQFNKNRHSLTLKITSRNRQQLFIIKVHFLFFRILIYILIHILSSLNHDYDRF